MFCVIGVVGGISCNIVATAACRALISFDKTMSSRTEGRYLTDIHFVNIEQDVTRSMIDVFKSIFHCSMPGMLITL